MSGSSERLLVDPDNEDTPEDDLLASGQDSASGFLTPSARLWAAALRRAAADYALYYRDPAHPQFEACGVTAHAWLHSDSIDVGSFLFVCSVFGVRPCKIREKVQALTARDVQRFRGIDFGEE